MRATRSISIQNCIHCLLMTVFSGAIVSLSVNSIPAQESSGHNRDFDQSKLNRFGRFIEKEIEAGRIVGCSATLIKDNHVLYERTWGKRDREKDQDVEKDTIWRIYSMSKPITSVAVMQLVEKGKINLDDAAAKYLPEFKNLKVLDGKDEVDCKREMTVRDLLRHTSGLTYGFFGDTEVDKKYRRSGVMIFDKNLDQTVKKLSKIPLLHQPGTKFHYSVSTDVLGRIVEVASEMSFKEYLEKNIFKPLEMNDTFFTIPQDKQDRFAQIYAPDGDGKLKLANKRSSTRYLNGTELYSGGGGLCSTSKDYLQFCKMLINAGKHKDTQLLSPESIKQMFTNQLPQGAGRRGFRFGLGFSISRENDFSWGGAAGTRFWVDPKNKVTGVYMIQINPYRGRDYGNDFKKAAYQALQNKNR